MFNGLFQILDVPLVCIFTILVVFGVLILKNIYNIFLSLFISIFLLIFITSTLLTQQIYLGEFLIISTFFILMIIFFIFNLNNDFDDSYMTYEPKGKNIGLLLTILVLLFVFSLITVNFSKITSNKTIFVTNYKTENNIQTLSTQDEVILNDYLEKISLLNQNKIFQKLTHLVMFYTCAVIVLYFFNKKDDDNEG